MPCTQGALQDVRVVGGSGGHLSQCPDADADCPSCGQFLHLADELAATRAMVKALADRVNKRHACILLIKLQQCDVKFNRSRCCILDSNHPSYFSRDFNKDSLYGLKFEFRPFFYIGVNKYQINLLNTKVV